MPYHMDRDDAVSDPYQPVACGFHDVLEDVAVRRSRCRIVFRAEAETLREVDATIDDIFAREGAEYALLGTGEEVRLDRLVRVERVDSG